MVILEGCDNSGKTTLAKAIQKEFNIPYTHSEKPDSCGSVITDMLNECMPSADICIRDRISPISEMVYGPICREGSITEGIQWTLIEMICKTNNLIVYCRPSAAKIKKFGEREQMEGVIDNVGELIRRYDWVFNIISARYPHKVIRYNYAASEPLRKKVMKDIGSFIKKTQNDLEGLKSLENSWEDLYKGILN